LARCFWSSCNEILQCVRQRSRCAVGDADLALDLDLDLAHRDVLIAARHAFRDDGDADAGEIGGPKLLLQRQRKCGDIACGWGRTTAR
jgi:hypothetical protein